MDSIVLTLDLWFPMKKKKTLLSEFRLGYLFSRSNYDLGFVLKEKSIKLYQNILGPAGWAELQSVFAVCRTNFW